MSGAVSSLPYFGPTDAPTLPQPVLPGVPTTPFSPTPTNVPTFQTIMDLFKSNPSIDPMRAIGGQGNFDAGLKELAPSTGLRPEIQNALDLIKQRGDENKAINVSQAMSLAGRRGQAGSSTEAFGVGQAQTAADKATQDQSANILLANAAREQALQDARAKALFDRGGQEATIGAQLGLNEAQLSADQRTKLASLTSDEIASLRNMDFGNRQLTLEALLGQQGLDLQRQNIGVSQDIADQQAKYGLISGLGQTLLPGLLFGGGGGGGGLLGGGGGLLSGLFGGGGAGAGILSGAGMGNTAAASSLFPAGLGGVGTGATTAGLGMLPALGLAGAGILGYQSLSDSGKALIAPLVNPVKTVKTVVNKVGKAITNVFPF